MEQSRLPTRRRNNHVGTGYRIYPNPQESDLQSDRRRAPQQYANSPAREKPAAVQLYSPPKGRRKENGQVEQNREDDLRRAAALLAKSGSLLFGDLCESCSRIIQERLATISSGGSLDVNATKPNESRIGAAGDVAVANFTDKVQVAQTFYSIGTPLRASLDVPAMKPNESPMGAAGDVAVANFTNKAQVSQQTFVSVGTPLRGSTNLAEDGSEQWVDSEQHRQGGNASWQVAKDGKRPDDNLSSFSNHFTSELNNVVTKMASHSLSETVPSGPGKTELVKKTSSVGTAAQMLQLPSDISEHTRVMQVIRKKDFVSYERVNGNAVNVVEGLELHANIFSESEQKELVKFIYLLQEQGRNQKLRKRTYSEPRKWMRGKGRITIQFGCCYNYAVDKDGNPPGIVQDEEVDEIPEMLRMVIKRLVKWHVLPCDSVPDSCIINIYDVGDCIPPHIDHHDFVRPFCTLSLLSECDIVFGSNLKIVGPGTFAGSISIPLPKGSVLVLNGNGADVAKHAVPSVPKQRISITFRKMDSSKVPEGFTPDPELLSTQPLKDVTQAVSTKAVPKVQYPQLQAVEVYQGPRLGIASQKSVQNGTSESPHFVTELDFPPLQVYEPGRKREKPKIQSY